jgi:hypothetical protein
LIRRNLRRQQLNEQANAERAQAEGSAELPARIETQWELQVVRQAQQAINQGNDPEMPTQLPTASIRELHTINFLRKLRPRTLHIPFPLVHTLVNGIDASAYIKRNSIYSFAPHTFAENIPQIILKPFSKKLIKKFKFNIIGESTLHISMMGSSRNLKVLFFEDKNKQFNTVNIFLGQNWLSQYIIINEDFENERLTLLDKSWEYDENSSRRDPTNQMARNGHAPAQPAHPAPPQQAAHPTF